MGQLFQIAQSIFKDPMVNKPAPEVVFYGFTETNDPGILTNLMETGFEDITEKGENVCYQHFSPLSSTSSNLNRTKTMTYNQTT